MHKRSTNLIVGIVILASIFILIFGVRFLSDTKFREQTYHLTAWFDNVGTLTEGDPVKVNGVRKGKVVKISLEGNRVRVLMAINKEVQITEDSRIVIQNIGLMGERMIGIQLGSGKAMEPGAEMHGEFDSGIAEAMGMLGEVLTQVEETVKELQGIVRSTIGDEAFAARFNTIMNRLDRSTAVLNNLVSGNKAALQGSIDDLSYTAGEVRTFFDGNKEKLNTTVTNVEDISIRAKDMMEKAERITGDIEVLVTKLNSRESSVGMLLSDTSFVSDIKTTIRSADSLVKKIHEDGLKVGFW